VELTPSGRITITVRVRNKDRGSPMARFSDSVRIRVTLGYG
jgi:hypothetical protein